MEGTTQTADLKNLFGPAATNTPATQTPQGPGTTQTPVVPATIDAAKVTTPTKAADKGKETATKSNTPVKATTPATAPEQSKSEEVDEEKSLKNVQERLGRELDENEQVIYDLVKNDPKYMFFVSKGKLQAKTLDSKYIN